MELNVLGQPVGQDVSEVAARPEPTATVLPAAIAD